jgi:signal transduction histidine kinase
VANWLGAGAMSTQILHSIAFLAVMYILFLAIYIWIQGSQAALFFLVAWAVMLVSALIFILQLSNVLQSDNFTRNALQVGSALEVVLLSFALAYRINYYRLEKEKYQAEVIQQLQENEQIRSRIARDLHDDIGSTLSSIGILSQVVEYQIDKNPLSVKELVQRINESSQKVQRSLSDIVWTTRQTSNSFGEVLVKMKEFAAEVFEPKNINYYFQTENLPEIQLSANKQYNLYLIFKEAINNIVKYADATEVNIEISFENSELRLFVKDNGIGFDETLIKAGNGLGNMRKRAESLGGSITILSRVGKGSSIELKVQIKQS